MESKQWYKSKTVWAGIVTAVVGGLTMLGVGQVQGEEEQITELIMQIVLVISGIMAILGRIVAKSKIKAPGGLPLILIAACLLFAGCHCPQNDPLIIDSLETTAVVGHAQAADCQAWKATLPAEQQAAVDPFCLSLESMAGSIDQWLNIVNGGE